MACTVSAPAARPLHSGKVENAAKPAAPAAVPLSNRRLAMFSIMAASPSFVALASAPNVRPVRVPLPFPTASLRTRHRPPPCSPVRPILLDGIPVYRHTESRPVRQPYLAIDQL